MSSTDHKNLKRKRQEQYFAAKECEPFGQHEIILNYEVEVDDSLKDKKESQNCPCCKKMGLQERNLLCREKELELYERAIVLKEKKFNNSVSK